MKIITARPHKLLGECVRRIGALERAGKSCMFVVPAQYTLQAELEIMGRLGLKGSFLIDVLSPGRIQARVFERAGAPERVAFDERGKRMVLSEIIAQEKENLSFYSSAAESGAGGFTAKVSALIADLKRSEATPVQVRVGAEQLPEGSIARRKLEDAALLYAAYEQQMEGRLADAEDISVEMRTRMERSGVLEGQHVFVYGFDMITPTFAAELVHMDRLCASLTVAVETDENSAPDGRLFAPVNFSVQRLEKLAREAGRVYERERIAGGREIPEDLAQLERGLFALGAEPYPGECPHLSVRACSTPRAEVHQLGARMREMAMGGEDLAQMAIVYPKGSGYGALLSSILPQYGVAVYVAEKRAAGAHPLCRFLLSALAVVSGGWRTGDVIECAQAGFLHLSAEEISALSAYAEGVDLRGEAWKSPFTYIKSGDEEELAALNSARERLTAPLVAFGREIQRAKNARASVRAVVALLEGVGAADTLEQMRADLLEAGLAPEAEDCAQIWNALMETLDQLYTLLDGESAHAETALRLLQEGLSALELSALPPADGAVICGTIGNVRTAEVRVLFALGMNDAPGAADGGLLTQEEREDAARATGAYLGMTAAESAALAQLDELKVLTGATERVAVSFALADETGRALREGATVQAMRRLFPALTVTGGLAQEEMTGMLTAPGPALEALSVCLSEASDGRTELGERERAAFAALRAEDGSREALLAVTRRLGEPPQRRLPSAQARALYGRPVMSVSRLETFAQCPYRHFVRYGLVPEEPVEPGVDRAELGTLYHEAAERFTRAATAQPGFPELAPELCDRLMAEAIAPLLLRWRSSPLGQSARGRAVARRVEKTAKRTARSIVSQFADSRFRPMRTELVFGQNGIAPITLELADGSHVYLQGRIDRVDVLDGSGMIRVIDYKSGAKKLDPTMAYWGLQLQLLIYLAAALEEIPGAQPAGFFYCRIADPTVKTESRIREEVEKQIARRLALAGISLSDVEILRAQGATHAAMVTKDGRPSTTYKGSIADKERMEELIGFARHKAAQLAQEAYDGMIDDYPAELAPFSACQTCRYAAVCGFDPAVKPRHRLSKKTLDDLRG